MNKTLELPTPPEFTEDGYIGETEEITNPNELVSTGKEVNLNFDQQTVKDDDLTYLMLQPLEKSLLKEELSHTGMYLKNIHKGFKFARSTRSLINLVGAGLAVHKHRRQLLKDLKENKKGTLQFDENGNLLQD